MVHNGIEYAMMQMISEVYDLLHRAGGLDNSQLHQLFKKWNEGQLQSFLIEITAEVFNVEDNLADGNAREFLVDKILDQAGSKGTGKWTSQESMNLPVAIPTIDAAVAMRDLSVYKEQRTEAAALYQPTIKPTKMTEEVLSDLENALSFGFLMAYAQGLSMLAKASDELDMNIPLPSVITVWKAGCIIRSALLGNFTDAFQREPKLANLLLDKEIALLAKNRQQTVRNIISMAVQSGVPVAALSSAVAYFDSYVSERLPTNLIQAQRDFFGAHTYKRIDQEGVFHTEWESGTV
jgi:6-phosphogluconate dehydrogenase